MNRAVFLDRDGVINRAVLRNGLPFPPESVQDLEVLPGVPEALALLRSAGFKLVVVTNQPDVARGRQTRAEVEAIHGFLTRTLPLDAVKVCYHDDADRCSCRKPLPGMLLEAAAEMALDLSRSYMVGDRWKDIEAGERAGTVAILVENEYPEKKPGNPAAKVGSLREAAEWILAREKSVHMKPENLKVKIFADGADRDGMLEMYKLPYIRGFTTNPTLMRKAGIKDYRAFAKEMVRLIPDRPLSFEVFSDDFRDMERQAMEIAGWGANVYVKIPVTNTKAEPAYDLAGKLSHAGVRLNVTAIMTLDQVRNILLKISPKTSTYISIFAGRIADTGRDPLPLMAAAVELLKIVPSAELIWASPRELLNVFHAEAIGCHIITVTNDVLKKMKLVDYDLTEYSLDTVKMFHEDARNAGFTL